MESPQTSIPYQTNTTPNNNRVVGFEFNTDTYLLRKMSQKIERKLDQCKKFAAETFSACVEDIYRKIKIYLKSFVFF